MRWRCCIAGGAVRDALIGRTPDDIDIFIFGSCGFDLVCGAWPAAEGFGEVRLGYSEEDDGVAFAETTWGGHDVQLICAKQFGIDRAGKTSTRSKVYNVPALMECFDWNICCFAFDEQGLHCFENPEALWPGGSLRIRPGALDTPDKAFKRGKEFAARYGLKLPYEELRKIAQRVREEKFEYYLGKTQDFFKDVAALL